MPQVASDLKSQLSAYAASRASSQAAKQAYASENAATTPFDSILDDTARAAAPEPRPQRAANDSSARTERPKSADRTAKSDNTDRPAAADAAAKPDSAAPAKAAATDSQTTDAKSADPATDDDAKAAGDGAQQATDAKTPDAVATVVPVAVVIDPAVAAAATAQDGAKGEVKADTAAIGATAAAAAAAAATGQPAAAAVNGKAELADGELGTGEAAKGTPDALAALAAKADKAAAKADAKADKTDKKAATDKTPAAGKGAETAPALPQAETADQAAAGAPHKDSIAHARTEETVNSHRGAATDATAAAGNDAANTVAAKTADITQPASLTTTQAITQAVQAQAVAAPIAAARAAATASDAAVPISGVAIEITNKALAGKGQFDIRLDPPDLGKIHVRLEVDRDGNVITHMVADRTDTLDMLRKDTAGLERALQDAGLKTSDNSLQFSLRDQSANQQQSNGGNANTARIVVEDEKLGAKDTAQRNYARYNATTGGLDIRV